VSADPDRPARRGRFPHRVDLAARRATVVVDVVAVVALLAGIEHAVAAAARALEVAGRVAAVAVEAVAVVALLAALDLAVAADGLMVRCVAAVAWCLEASIAGPGCIDCAAAADRRVGPRHDGREEHTAGEQAVH